MAEFPFNWKLRFNGKFHETKNCNVSNFKINAEWRLKFLYSENNEYKPVYVEIHRTSTGVEIFVSGTFHLMEGSHCVYKRKFVQLMESSSKTTIVELEYFSRDSCCYGISYSITGTLKITPGMPPEESAKEDEYQSLLNLSNDFKRLLDPNSTYFSDVNILCGTDSFPSHKTILSARSPVFARMFATQMKEKQLNKVDIIDISSNVLKNMLSYIYTGKTEQLTDQSARELLFAAEKYQIQDLKRVCIDYLKSSVSVQNVLGTFVLGYFHDQDLQVFAMDFICNIHGEFEVLENTVEWRTLREEMPSLAIYVLTLLLKSKDKKLKERK